MHATKLTLGGGLCSVKQSRAGAGQSRASARKNSSLKGVGKKSNMKKNISQRRRR